MGAVALSRPVIEDKETMGSPIVMVLERLQSDKGSVAPKISAWY